MSQSRTNITIDLRGKICPYPVVRIIENVDGLEPGEKLIFLVDDPLAVKSVPEEIEELSKSSEIDFHIEKQTGFWEITVSRE